MSYAWITWNQNLEKKKYTSHGYRQLKAYLRTKDIYSDIGKDVETKFDTSNYKLDRSCLKKIKKVSDLMKDGSSWKIMKEFLG